MKIYVVGGAVRDQLLNRQNADKDYVVVGAAAREMLDLGYQAVGKHFPVFLHPETHEEYALARTERKTGAGHQAFEFHAEPNVTLEEDLIRRDLTINAIAMGDNGQLIDPYNGKTDLDNRVLRHVSNAFAEDPLRVLRVARFKAQLADFGFEIAPETMDLMQTISASGELSTLSNERIWTETEKALLSDQPKAYFETLEQCGALTVFWDNLNWQALCSGKATIRYASMLVEGKALFTAPNDYAQLAQLAHDTWLRLDETVSAESLWHVLKKLDYARRPERFADCMVALSAYAELKNEYIEHVARIQNGAEILSTLDYSDIAKSDLPGKEKAEQIKARQVESLRPASRDTSH